LNCASVNQNIPVGEADQAEMYRRNYASQQAVAMAAHFADYLREEKRGFTVEQLASHFQAPSELIRKALDVLRKDRLVFSLPGDVWKYDRDSEDKP
jgi:hypothetical protein